MSLVRDGLSLWIDLVGSLADLSDSSSTSFWYALRGTGEYWIVRLLGVYEMLMAMALDSEDY